MQLFVRSMQAWVDPADVFVTLFARDPNSFWLDREVHPTARYSVMGHAHGNLVLDAKEAMENLESRAPSVDLVGQEIPGFAWRPGFVGWFDYSENPLDPADLRGTFLEAREAIVFDHDSRNIWFVGEFPGPDLFEEWIRAVLLRLGLSGGQARGYRQRHAPFAKADLINMAHDPADYLAMIRRAQIEIAAGEVYQLCLTNQLTFRHNADPLAVFLQLREVNPAPYACYVRAGSRTLVGSSPEQFLVCDEAGRVSTRPIKGTRPRSQDPSEDNALAAELRSNIKERAENLMIVDLMRNDLARVSVPDSVTVDQLFQVEQYATVHQLVSSVSAQIRPDVPMVEVIAAVFPGGSMTGAPKIRAMQLIAEIEGIPRGVYSGAAGYLGRNGSLELGMNIRSLVFDLDTVSIGVGGGITIDSDPQSELAETQLKAVALLSVINADNPWDAAK